MNGVTRYHCYCCGLTSTAATTSVLPTQVCLLCRSHPVRTCLAGQGLGPADEPGTWYDGTRRQPARLGNTRGRVK